MKKIVIAIGGNAITQDNQKGTIEEQRQNILHCCELIADLIQEGYEIVVTHGNGPQVGNLVLQNDMAKRIVPENPLDICDAQTQGSLGYLIAQTMSNVLRKRKISKQVVAVLSQVAVDESDPGFCHPTKFIGPFFEEEDARVLQETKGFLMKKDSNRGYRRVVASPKPIGLVEKEAVRTLLDQGFFVIAVGGGGIPVICKNQELKGVEAVVDKDYASALVAEEINADTLVILTGVQKVAVDFGKPSMRELDRLTPEECRMYLEQGQFPAGSMGPKIDAALQFASRRGKAAVITSIEYLKDALEGKNGTRIG